MSDTGTEALLAGLHRTRDEDAANAEAEQTIFTDGEFRYLVERHPDGHTTLATRPVGGARWSPPLAREAS